jgi:outer membrane protein insertion porin family
MGLCVRLVRGLVFCSMVLGGILVGAGVAGIASSTVAVAQTANSIVVNGNRRIEAATVRSYFRAGSDGRLSPFEIDQGLKALYATGLFSDVKIDRAGGRLVVTVVENPIINQVAFEGNKKVKDEQLALETQSKPRGTLSKPTVQTDVQRIIEIYHRSGRFDVRVVPKIIELPNNRVNLVFEIHEGNKTGVKEIRFVGAHAFSYGRLKNVIKTSVSGWLSFLQSTDIYDPDRVEADRDLLRRFYLKHGYADVRIVSAVGEYDPAKKGFVITFTIDEGPKYHIGKVNIISNVHAVSPDSLRDQLKIHSGDIYNADLVQKTVESMTITAAKRGYAFANVRPRGDRNFSARTINLVFVVEEGARAYIERINIRGNTRTRDYVIRREFDIGEGDPYNRALIDRAERRLNNLRFFKKVRITNEPGSAPDRVVINVDVEEQSTGEFSISGGYSTTDGFIADVSIAERNLMGRGQFIKVGVTYGERVRGFDFNFVEPFLFGYRMSGGINVYARQNLASDYISYDTQAIGTTLKLGFALTENWAFSPRYYNNGEASLAVRSELANGPVLVSSAGYTLSYNSLDNNKSPTDGIFGQFKQDLAGLGGDVNFIRSTVDVRRYQEVLPDVVSLIHLQGGHASGWGGEQLRMLDHFFMGPNLVRGFAPAGIGPRDLQTGNTQDALGGSLYWGASLELQTPLYFLPKDIGIKAAAFVDAGSLWDYKGPTFYAPTGESITPADSDEVRSSVGIGFIWASPLGPLRFDLAYPLSKASYDKTQVFRFSGGAKF